MAAEADQLLSGKPLDTTAPPDHTIGMAYVFMILGYAWALNGALGIVAQIILGSPVLLFGIAVNMLLYVIPGYLLGATAHNRIDNGRR